MDKCCAVTWCVALPEPGRSRCKCHQQDDQFPRPPVSKELLRRYEEETTQCHQ